ncbi:branched-chain amino acid ABC transporter permease [Spirulina sp. CS-785/01]|uniref:branched-chain amino acid ABC transporter permease n=1 Tax=Spirulina sp. CS-785/01 TaxID=3021716 RepID=UPI0023311737|nr:branched-chain amino acid ABC transporter permease [Spirulina sp. CS-785/01]MDB9315762.1 branched-chain amino acid ABC transporter permease [Spirulina sp. CS-785/01]
MVGYLISLIIFTGTFTLFSLGLNLQWGFTGLINFGHVGFLAIGAYTTVLLTGDFHVPLIVASLIGGGLAAILGLLIGFTTLRLREDYLAIVTIGVSELIRLIALNEEWLTNGPNGVYGFPLPLEDFSPNLLSKMVMVVILTGLLVLAYWRMWRWLLLRLRGKEQGQLLQNAGLVAGYVLTLMSLLYGVGVAAKNMKEAETFSPPILGLFLAVSLIIVVGGYIVLARWLFPRLQNWHYGANLVSVLGVSGFGLWLYGAGIRGIFDYDYRVGLMLILLLTLALVYWRLEWLVQSPWGRILKSIREDEEVAKALGKNVFWYKLQSLMLGGAIAGIAGSFYAWQLTFINPDGFKPLVTFQAWTIVMLGGAGNNIGTLLGATIFWGYTTITRFILKDIIPLDDARLGAFRLMIIGLILVVLMLTRPQGILGKKEELTLGR